MEKKKSKYKPVVRNMPDDIFEEKFPTEAAAVEYFLKLRYGGNIVCRHCGMPITYRYKDRLKAFHCYHCHNSFSPFEDTIFYKTHLPLRKWFRIISLFLNDKVGVSSLCIARQIGVTEKTAWRVLQQIRIAMGNDEMNRLFTSLVEIDEAYIGGKPRKQNAWVQTDGSLKPRPYPKKNKRGRGTKKIPVVGMKERSTGHVKAKVLLPNEKNETLTGQQLLDVIEKWAEKYTTVISDESNSYNMLDKPDSQFSHESVNHSKGEYCNYIHKWITTNGIEGFWGVIKPALESTYRNRQTLKYLQRYLDEFVYRQNTGKDKSAFDKLLRRTVLRDKKVITDTIIELPATAKTA